jgi:hypothetical protein
MSEAHSVDWKGMYEGSQRSLSDMAAQQAHALSRAGWLRTQIVMGLKRAFPNEFTQAERALGKRLGEVDDDLLIAFLTNFLLMAAGRTTADAVALNRLRGVAEGLGIDISGGGGMLDVAEAIGAWAEGGGHHESGALPAPADTALSALPVTTAPQAPATARGELADLFDDSSTDSTLRDLFDDDVSREVANSPEPVQGPWEQGSQDAKTEAPAETDASVAAGPDTTSLDDLFGEDVAGHTATSRESVSGDGTPAKRRRPSVRTERITPRDVDEVVERSISSTGGIRPSLLPVAPKTRQRRGRTNVSASATPGESSVDVPVLEGEVGALTDQLRDQLRAAVAVPRPVFAADLVAMVRSADVVAEWEGEEIGAKQRSMYVISPKSRHKLMGSLMFPKNYFEDAPAEFRNSLWARCLPLYSGAKLYEIGVVLHRFNEDVVSYEASESTLALRLALPQGLVGVVMLLDGDLSEGSVARTALISQLEAFTRERLVQVAVLSYMADNLDMIAAVVEEEAEKQHWSPAFPVTLSRSWEFANGTGVALPLLG